MEMIRISAFILFGKQYLYDNHKNSFVGHLNFGDSDLPETTKSGREHGMGLNNIRRVARMYMGDISLEQGNEEVILSIMMQVE